MKRVLDHLFMKVDKVYKEGANGRFIGCSNYPACKYVKKEPKKDLVYTGETCPVCGKPLVERSDRKGKKFIACSGYPTCTYIKPTEDLWRVKTVIIVL